MGESPKVPIQGSVLYMSRRTETEKLQRKEEFSSQTPAVLRIPPVSATTSREGSKRSEVPQLGVNSPFSSPSSEVTLLRGGKALQGVFLHSSQLQIIPELPLGIG